MLTKRRLSLLLSSLLMLVAAAPVLALGFGASSPAAVLGQALDLTVAVRVNAGEDFAPECARAAVTMGDRLLPAAAVQTVVERGSTGQATIRVRTTSPVEEPVVTVEVSNGCTARMSRRFVLFADPPLIAAPPALATTAPSMPASIPVAVAAVEAAPSKPATSTASASPRSGRAKAASPAAVSAQAIDVARPARSAVKRPRKPVATQAPQPPVVAAAPAGVARPRLRLDAAPEFSQSGLSDEALATVDEANRVIESAIEAASAAQLRITTLETGIERMRLESEAQRAQIADLRARTAAAEGRSQWIIPLLLLALAIAGLATWFWSRMRALERERQASWWLAAQEQEQATAADPGGPDPADAQAPVDGSAPAPQPEREPLDLSSSWDLPGEVHAVAQTGVLSTRPLVQEAPPSNAQVRGVSAEELIDLEQQAEFFVVLGQDDAAIELLVGHLRETGGASPLPYLNLLDIYRRLGDPQAYERTRGRFNRRFNAHAPAWNAPGAEGRSLDDYAAIMGWIQRVWPKPLDAMAEIESMLFRRDGGELFDLPAYRELLFLYALARDLTHEDDPVGASLAVDLLLPMFDGPQADAASATASGVPEREAIVASVDDEVSLDLDLDISVTGDITQAADLPITR